MMMRHDYPILEFDDNKVARINPDAWQERVLSTDKLIITFFPEVIERLKQEGQIVTERIIDSENPVELYRFQDTDVLIKLGCVGCPSCAGNLDMLYGMGVNKVMFCGGGGVLDREIAVGHVMVVEGAIRDEGFSYHYLPPARMVYADPKVVSIIADYLDSRGVPYFRGLAWTTDAVFRETQDRILKRKAEGAKIVEMEQAGCLAVAEFRGFSYGALIYGGDDVSQDKWDKRGWRSREGTRYDLVQLCKALVKMI